MKPEKKHKFLLFKVALMMIGIMMVVTTTADVADAMSFDLGEDVSMDCDVQLIYAAGIRVEDPDPRNLDINGDDGNRNFDKWDLINNRFSTIIDVDLKYKNFGFFIRPKAYYDFVYMGDNANDSPSTNNALAGGLISKTDEFTDEAEEVHGADVQLLDYFAYADFDIGKAFMSIRVGNQVVQWGESLVIAGIAGAMAHTDTVTLTTPGTEFKEVVLPSQGVSFNIGFGQFAFAAYYQWEWKHSVYYEGGSFFNTALDFLDESKAPLFLAPGVPVFRGTDIEPDDEDQYGIRFSYTAGAALNYTEFGLYYLNYRLKDILDVAMAQSFDSFGFMYWQDDVDLYGASISTEVYNWNISGEVAYHRNFPIATNTGYVPAGVITANAFTVDDFIQAQVSGIYVYIPGENLRKFFDTLTVLGEMGCQYITDLDDDELVNDKFAWIGIIRVIPSIQNLRPGLKMDIPLTYAANPNSKTGIGYFAQEGISSISLGLDFVLDQVYKFSIAYTNYMDDDHDGMSDRDNINCKFTYTF